GAPILRFGSEAQQRRWLPVLADGTVLGALAMTEPGAGSDVSSLATRARRDGDGYVLNGEKIMVTNGGPARLFVVLATVDPTRGAKGLTAFLVPGEAAGLTRGPRDRTLGLWPCDVRSLHFENVRVGAEGRLGEEGHGLRVVL